MLGILARLRKCARPAISEKNPIEWSSHGHHQHAAAFEPYFPP